jgi:hypothetical protein
LQVPLCPAKLLRAWRPSLPHISNVTTRVFVDCMYERSATILLL